MKICFSLQCILKKSSLGVSFECYLYKQQPGKVTNLACVQFNTYLGDYRDKHNGSYSILKEQRGEEVNLMQKFWTENLALISIRVPSGPFPVTFLVMLAAASPSQPLRKMLYLIVSSHIKQQLLGLMHCCKHWFYSPLRCSRSYRSSS